MENYTVALLSDAQGAVLTAKKVTLGFQSNMAVSANSTGNLVDINITVDAEQESVLRDGSVVVGQMKQVALRGAELEKLLLTMPDGDEKTYSAAKLAIWKAFNGSIQTAMSKALKAQYLLDNPVTTV